MSTREDFEKEANSLEEFAAYIGFGWIKVLSPERVQLKISQRMSYLFYKIYGEEA